MEPYTTSLFSLVAFDLEDWDMAGLFITFEGNQGFFVRGGNASIPKNREEQSEYEKLHWN